MSADPPAADDDPMTRAREWLPDNDEADRPQITLATTGLDGCPAARTVLLTAVADGGFTFHTDARSAKAAELTAEPRCCLTVLWPGFTRQLVIQGTARPQDDAGARDAFARRSPYLRHLAWLNDTDHARATDDDRRDRFSAAVAVAPDGPADPPPTWAGFVVLPHRVVFWESAADAASRRTEYRRSGDGWSVDLLPG